MRKFNLKSIVPFTLLLGSVGISNNGTSNLMMEKSYLNYDSEIQGINDVTGDCSRCFRQRSRTET